MMMCLFSVVFGQVPSGYTIVKTHNDEITWYEVRDNSSGEMAVAYNNKILCYKVSEAFCFHGFIMAKPSGWNFYYVFDKQGNKIKFGNNNIVNKVEIVGDNLFFFYGGVYDENLNKIADREGDFSKCGNKVYLITKENGKYGIYDWENKNQVLPSRYKSIDILAGGLCEINDDGKLCIYDLKNEQQIPEPSNYDKVRIIKVQVDGNGTKEFRYIVKKDGKQGVCDINGKEIIVPNYYDKVWYCNIEDNHFFVVEKDNKEGVCDKDGQEIMHPIVCDDVEVVGTSDAFYYIVKKNGKKGVCDMKGREIVATKYDNVYYRIRSGYFDVRLDNKLGVCDMNGHEIIVPKYDDIFKNSDGCYKVKLNGKEGICDATGQEIIAPLVWEEISVYDEYIIVKLNGKKGVYDKDGHEIIEPQYDNIFKDHRGFYDITLNGKKGICDIEGLEIIAPKYDGITLYTGYYKVELDGKEGVCDKNGKEIVAPKYESILCSSSGVFKYKDASGKYISLGIDVNGNACIDPNYAYEKYFDEGQEYFARARYGKAAKSYKKALEYRQTSLAYYNVAASYYNQEKYENAITYFQYCLNNGPGELEDRALELINKSRQYLAQKEARRQEIAEAFIGGAIAFAAGVASASMGVSNPTTGGNMDYLLDPNYAILQAQQQQAEFDAINQQLINLSIWQTEQQEYETYLLMTSGGTTMTFEEWKAIAAQAAMNESFNSDMSYFISDDPSEMEYKGKLSPDQYQAAYRSYENSAAGYYRALTIGGVRDQDKNGNIQGKTVGQISGGGYATWKQGLSKAQAEMRRIRQEAAQYGVTIQQSQWETATVSY